MARFGLLVWWHIDEYDVFNQFKCKFNIIIWVVSPFVQEGAIGQWQAIWAWGLTVQFILFRDKINGEKTNDMHRKFHQPVQQIHDRISWSMLPPYIKSKIIYNQREQSFAWMHFLCLFFRWGGYQQWTNHQNEYFTDHCTWGTVGNPLMKI